MLSSTSYIRAGAGLVTGAVAANQVANWYAMPSAVDENMYSEKWLRHYTDIANSLKIGGYPEPVIYKEKEIVLRGALKPKNARNASPGMEYVYKSNGEYVEVDMHDLLKMTDKIYFKHLAHVFEKRFPVLSTRKRKDGKALSTWRRSCTVRFIDVNKRLTK